jgi:hypothetical protein
MHVKAKSAVVPQSAEPSPASNTRAAGSANSRRASPCRHPEAAVGDACL